METFASSDPSYLLELDFQPHYGLTQLMADLATLEVQIRERLDRFARGLVYIYDVTKGCRFPIEIETGILHVIDKNTGLIGGYLHVIMPQHCTQSLRAVCA